MLGKSLQCVVMANGEKFTVRGHVDEIGVRVEWVKDAAGLNRSVAGAVWTACVNALWEAWKRHSGH